ncbi:MAG: hypothetical protein M3O31_16475 [Acidobacteriota bacterium]|nr:hypothetical protein [Acidobacteriota bacterium]
MRKEALRNTGASGISATGEGTSPKAPDAHTIAGEMEDATVTDDERKPVPVVAPRKLMPTAAGVGAWLLLSAFTSGYTAISAVF